jgi:AraC family transcriptional regulator
MNKTVSLFAMCALLSGCASVPTPLPHRPEAKETSMTPKIISLDQMLIAGVVCHGNNSQGEIQKLWPVYNENVLGIETRINDAYYYGVQVYPPDFFKTGRWFYMAGVEVKHLDGLPVVLTGKVIPANKYAVFTHKGPLFPGKIVATYRYIYDKWLPESGHKQAGFYDLERYGPNYKGETEDSELEILIPIK